MEIQNDITKVKESLNYIKDLFDNADFNIEDNLNVCLNNFLLFVDENEYFNHLIEYNANNRNELFAILINIINVAYKQLADMRSMGMTIEDKDKMCCYINMSLILSAAILKLYERTNSGKWPTD